MPFLAWRHPTTRQTLRTDLQDGITGAVIALTEAVSIARSLADKTGQRLGKSLTAPRHHTTDREGR